MELILIVSAHSPQLDEAPGHDDGTLGLLFLVFVIFLVFVFLAVVVVVVLVLLLFLAFVVTSLLGLLLASLLSLLLVLRWLVLDVRAGHPSQDAGQEVVLEVSLPQGVGQLGHGEEEGEEVGQPEVVRRDQEVLVGLHFIRVNVAARCATLEVISHIGSSVYPAVGTEGRQC